MDVVGVEHESPPESVSLLMSLETPFKGGYPELMLPVELAAAVPRKFGDGDSGDDAEEA